MTSALFRDLGGSQGRVQPAGWQAPAGSWAFVLGSDVPGRTDTLLAGESLVLQQTADVGPTAPTPHTLIPFRMRLRGPATLPQGWAWVVTWGDGFHENSVEIPVGRTLDFDAQAIWVRQSSSPTTVRFRLLLTGPANTPTEVELPGVYLDGLALADDTRRLAPVFTYPEDGHTEVPRAQPLVFSLADLGPAPAAINTALTRVFVNGVVAYDQGVFVAPYNAGGSSYSQGPGVLGTFVLAHADAPFASDADVTVLVQAFLQDGTYSFASWTFHTADETAPALVAAQALGVRQVRVTFSEPMSDTALDPNGYGLVGVQVPYFVPGLVRVERVGPGTFDLTFDAELSPGITYQLTAVGLEDVAGNPVDPAANTAAFVAVVPAQPVGRRFDLYELLPAMNRREDVSGDLRNLCLCLQDVVTLLLADIDQWVDIFDPDLAPEWALDLMLASMGNPFRFDLSVTDKRRLVQLLVGIYRQKGTAPGIRNVVRFFLGVEVSVVQFDSQGFELGVAELGALEPPMWELGAGSDTATYSFDVESAVVLTPEQRQRLRTLVEYMKPAHTHFMELREPTVPTDIDHVELGLSSLDTEFILH